MEPEDDGWPSGPWKGFWTEPMPDRRRTFGFKNPMELHLTFQAGSIRGAGQDGVGPFTISGGYNARDATCWWSKRYPWHDVAYKGHFDGKSIFGSWELRGEAHGGFRIWPKGSGEGEEAVVEEALPEPAPTLNDLRLKAKDLGAPGRLKSTESARRERNASQAPLFKARRGTSSAPALRAP